MTLASKSVVVNNTIEGRIRYISKSLNRIFSKLDTMKPQPPFSLPLQKEDHKQNHSQYVCASTFLNCPMFTWIIPYSNNAIPLWLQTHKIYKTCTYESVWHSVGWTGRSRSLLENSLTLWLPSFPPASGAHPPPAAHFYPQGLDTQTHYDHKKITYYSFYWSVKHHVSKSNSTNSVNLK